MKRRKARKELRDALRALEQIGIEKETGRKIMKILLRGKLARLRRMVETDEGGEAMKEDKPPGIG